MDKDSPRLEPIRPSAVYAQPLDPPRRFADEHLLRRTFSSESIEVAMRMHLLPSLYVRRKIVRVDVSKPRLFKSITQEFILPQNEKGTQLLIPVETGQKNDLRDDSTVSSSNGVSRRLTSDEELNFSQLLILVALQRALSNSDAENLYPNEYAKHRDALLLIATMPSWYAWKAIRDAVLWIRRMPIIESEGSINYLIVTCLTYAENFVRLVEVRERTDDQITIVRESDDSWDQNRLSPSEWKWRFLNRWSDNVRAVLGRKSSRFVLRFSRVGDSRSFHIFVPAPEGHHIHRQDIYFAARRSSRQHEEAPRRTVTSRLYRATALGQDQAHIYFSAKTQDELLALNSEVIEVDISVAENLPGSILPAFASTASAFAIAVLLIVVANPYSTNQSQAGSISAAFPALLLTIPGVVSLAFRTPEAASAVNSPLISALAPPVTLFAAFWLGSTYFLAATHKLNCTQFLLFSLPVLLAHGIFALLALRRLIYKIRREIPACDADQPRGED